MTTEPPIIFLLGRPGCGKSVIYEMLTKNLKGKGFAYEFLRIDDFPILKELLDRDVHFKRHRREAGGFKVTDWSIVDEVLAGMSKKIERLYRPGRVIFVEFARDSYLHAFSNFTPQLLKKSLILYVFAPYEVCCQRNIKRFKERKGHDLDAHIVPPHLMETYYKEDDFEKLFLESGKKLEEVSPIPLIVIDSSKTDWTYLESEIDRVAGVLGRMLIPGRKKGD